MILSHDPAPQEPTNDDQYEEIGKAAELTRNGRASVTENNRGHG